MFNYFTQGLFFKILTKPIINVRPYLHVWHSSSATILVPMGFLFEENSIWDGSS